jgi:diguanylate cyclase (GGDEF)-like protein/PAS domain S-box-containing protein
MALLAYAWRPVTLAVGALHHAALAERRLNTLRLRERQFLNACPDGILWVNQAGRIMLANPAMEGLSGYAVNELEGQNVDIFLPQHLRARHGEAIRDYFRNPRARPMGVEDLVLVHRSGEAIPVDISLGFWDDEDESHAIAYIQNLSERKGFEESLRHRALHDQLTGLPNRWLFNLQLTQALALAKRNKRQVAVLMLNLDDFKSVNDSFGHASGDALLVQVAQRLQGALREHDTLARLGGDEFAILLGDLQHTDEALTVAEKLIATMAGVFPLQGQHMHSKASIGLAFYPADAQDSEDIMRCADMAMHQAKLSARALYACYSLKLELHARENLQLHARLKEALDQGRLKLLYQPKMDASGENIVGAEALLRWIDAELGEVSPARFIPVAESTGLILALSDWVLETACRQIAAWQHAGTPLPVAVNFSAQQFHQGNVAEQVRAALQRTGAHAHLLEIEITESIAMEHPDAAHEQLSALVALGCSVALDDFGTGYSSLAYLKYLPVSVLKIDRAFVKDLPNGKNDAKICRAIIALAHSLDMTLVAEGVETDAQLAFLRSYGCEAYQGWLFAKAMPAAELTVRLEAYSSPIQTASCAAHSPP